MSHAKKTYLVIGVIFSASLLFFFWHPGGDFIQSLAGTTFVGSTFALLIQILRDQATHDRALFLLSTQNNFSLGASSHMANIAFDKHVMFSEEYAQEVNVTIRTLFTNGPTQKTLEHANKLYLIREKYIVWLTVEIENSLDKFEKRLRGIGADAYLVGASNDLPNRQDVIARMDLKVGKKKI